MRFLVRLAVVVLAGLTVIGLVFLLGMRKKSPVVVDAVRRLNREFMNPQQMETAGTSGAYAAIIRHTGRTSGKEYQTPIGATHTERGFVVMLPYGTNTDWLKNVMAKGSAVLVHEGAEYPVESPEVIPFAEVADDLSDNDGRMATLFGVTECLRLQPVT